MQENSSKLRSIFTGCEPISKAERDERWAKVAQQFPQRSPGKENLRTVPASAFQTKSPRIQSEGPSPYTVRPLASTPPRPLRKQPTPGSPASPAPNSPSKSPHYGHHELAEPKQQSPDTVTALNPVPGFNNSPRSATHSRTLSSPSPSSTPVVKENRNTRVMREFDALLASFMLNEHLSPN